MDDVCRAKYAFNDDAAEMCSRAQSIVHERRREIRGNPAALERHRSDCYAAYPDNLDARYECYRAGDASYGYNGNTVMAAISALSAEDAWARSAEPGTGRAPTEIVEPHTAQYISAHPYFAAVAEPAQAKALNYSRNWPGATRARAIPERSPPSRLVRAAAEPAIIGGASWDF